MSERFTVGECMGCGKQGSTPVYIINGAAVSQCDQCRPAQAEKERALLADWGTIGQKRTT